MHRMRVYIILSFAVLTMAFFGEVPIKVSFQEDIILEFNSKSNCNKVHPLQDYQGVKIAESSGLNQIIVQ